MEKILEIKNLTVNYVTDEGRVHAVNGLNLELLRGSTLGLVGETGAGKTTTAKAIMRLLPNPQGKVLSGEILVEGQDLLKLPIKQMQKIRGERISMIFQDPMTSLNPVLRIGEQIEEVILLHQTKSKQEANQLAKNVLAQVGIVPERINEYPHQFSGGMKQRVGIAMALACNPEILIADEPTTALDVTIQAQVIELMKQLKSERDMSMVMITHDLGIVAEICDYVAVMYAGTVVEYGTKQHIYNNMKHPYTVGLFQCIPDLTKDQEYLTPIEGNIADPTILPAGCVFADRCKVATAACVQSRPPAVEVEPGHLVQCHKFEHSI